MTCLKQTLALLTFAAGASVCSAGTVHVEFANPIFTGSGYDNVFITFPKLGGGSTTENVLAGRFKGKGSSPDLPASIFVDGLDNLYMYCYDVYESINHGSIVDYTVNFDGERDRTRDFIGAVNAVMNAGKSSFDQYAWLHPVNGSQGAAIQLGIWDSLYETSPGWDIATGSFYATALDSGTSIWLNDFFNKIPFSDSIDKKYVMTFEATGAQDMITGDPPSPVPEPGSIALFGAALAALVCTRRQQARQG